jgi:hypothetical protein
MAGSQQTLPTREDVDAFIAAVPAEARREDARTLRQLLAEWTGEPPTMWGSSIVGFGSCHYRYDSGHEGTAALVGFAPRKYLKRLDAIDLDVLRELVERTVRVHRGADRAAGG